jgi:quinol monooxygenase YgiN
MIRVVARIPAKPETVEDVKALLTGLIEPTRKEAGCIQYDLWQNLKMPTDFTFVEQWESAAALEAHLETEHLIHALGRFPDLLSGDADIQTYRLVA